MQYRAMAAVILLAFYFPTAAQEVQRIEVVGSNAAQRRGDTAGATLVSRDELLRHGDQSLADALRRVPGITVTDSGGKGSEIQMRGLGKGYTSVLLNGAPLPPGFSIDALAPAMIERVEIIRTASAELAAQGIAGTVNIILRRQAARVRNDVRLGLDSVGGVLAPSGSWQWAGSDEGTDWSLNGAVTRSVQLEPGFTVESGMDSAGVQNLSRHAQTMADNRTRSASLTPRVTWKRQGGSVAWQGFVNVAGRTNVYLADETTVLGAPTAYPDSGSWLDISTVMLRSEVTWQQELADGVKGQLRIGLQHYPRHSDFQFYTMRDGVRLPDVRRVRSDIRESTLTAGGKVEVAAAAGHSVTAGWDGETVVRSQNRAERDFDAGTLTDDRYRGHISRAAVFVQDDWTVSDAWSLSAGLRWEALRTAVTPQGGVQVVQSSATASPLLQSLYKWSAVQRLRAGLSRTYKTPAMLELIPRRYTIDNGNNQTNPDTQGNPRLRPELAWGLDASVERDIGSGGMVSASAYRRRIDNVNVPLLFEDQGRWVRTPANQGRADVWGVAAEFKATVTPRWTVRAHAARDWSRVLSVPGPDNRLARQTPRSAGAGTDVRYSDALTFGADVTWQDGGWTRESAFYAFNAPPSRKLDVYAAWKLGSGTRLKISGANLLRPDALYGAVYRDSGGARLLSEHTRSYAALRFSVEQRW
ncbi:bifunctional siderophore receptor/adhesin Iha [Pseudoduganella ginsengisoli]|nr:TonB-dependent receptor [Pseudoduganella ginsengisoli]